MIDLMYIFLVDINHSVKIRKNNINHLLDLLKSTYYT